MGVMDNQERHTLKIGDKVISDRNVAFVIGEIGINHNGDVEIAKRIIDMAAEYGFDAVKFQKRTVDVVYSKEEMEKPRETPFGTTNGDYKRAIEFGKKEYDIIDAYCKEKGIMWFASCWDEESVDFIDRYNPPAYKIASPCLTDDALLLHTKKKGKPLIISTGMSTMEQIEHAVKLTGEENIALLHCTSTYPAKIEELNLMVIPKFREKFGCAIGYSGHETGVMPSTAAAVLGAKIIERHITLDRAMWGSDQSASLEKKGAQMLVRDIKLLPVIFGDGVKKVYDNEKPIIEKLRRK
jgi:N-acetylneuraminate synthase